MKFKIAYFCGQTVRLATKTSSFSYCRVVMSSCYQFVVFDNSHCRWNRHWIFDKLGTQKMSSNSRWAYISEEKVLKVLNMTCVRIIVLLAHDWRLSFHRLLMSSHVKPHPTSMGFPFASLSLLNYSRLTWPLIILKQWLTSLTFWTENDDVRSFVSDFSLTQRNDQRR